MNAECETSIEQEDSAQYKKGGYHPVQVGDLFENRYLVIKKIGWGQFSTVWLCRDQVDSNYVALKISKSALYYSDAAVSEMNILQHICETQKNPELSMLYNRSSYIVNLLNSFTHRGPNGRHVVLVFEILGINLLEVIKIYNYKGLPLDISKSFLLQMLNGLDFLHRVCGVIHTDLKPENIVLQLTPTQTRELMQTGTVKTEIKRRVERLEAILPEPKPIEEKKNLKKTFKKGGKVFEKTIVPGRSRPKFLKKSGKLPKKPIPEAKDDIFSSKILLKIVDFGNATFTSGTCNNEIQTRQYRAPEVILGFKYGSAADMWSFGCIAFELLTGELLFQPKSGTEYSEDDDHLASIWETIGNFPLTWASTSKFAWKFFTKNGLKKVSELNLFEFKQILTTRYAFKNELAEEFSEFLLATLQIDPENRISAENCLKHPWLGPKKIIKKS